MESKSDVQTFSHRQLVALVSDLRRQLAAREREIARLQPSGAATPALDVEGHAPEAEPPPGTQAALRAQLERIYPDA